MNKITTGITMLGVTALTMAVAFNLVPKTASKASNITIVSPGNMHGWTFQEESTTGSGTLVSGPGTPTLGAGSANFIVNDSGGEYLSKPEFQGTKLSDIQTLSYSTYRTSGGDALAPSLQLNIDSDLTDLNNSWQGRLVYEPYYTQTVNTGAWQTWNTLNDSAGTGTGNWWFSNGTLATTSTCTQANPCTMAEVIAAFPQAGIHGTFGAIGFKAGSNWAGGFNGNVDALTIKVADVETVYDFEAIDPTPTTIPTSTATPTETPTPSATPTLTPTPVVPVSKDQCKNDGYKTFGSMFKNQGQCVSYVATKQ